MELMEKQGYKVTEVGLIPKDWNDESIGDLASISTGGSDTQDRVDDGIYPFFVRSQTIERINKYSFDGEAILTSGDGVGVGKIFHYVNCKFDYHQRVYNIHNYRKDVSGKYLYYQFSTKFYDRVMAMTAKSSVDSVRREMIADMKIPLPPTLEEQKAIATALSDVDELISNLDKLITKKKAIKQGAMQQLLTPPHKGCKRLEGFTGEWMEIKLGEIADFYKGKGLPKSDIVEGGRYKCIHYGELFTKYNQIITNVKSRTNQNSNVLLSKKNDVLMPTSDVTPNGLATASVIFENDIILGGDVLVIRPHKNLYGGFLSYQVSINKQQIMSLITGTTVFHLYGSDMAKFSFYFPDFEEQKAIVDIINDMDIEIEKLETKKTKYQSVKHGMMQELLTGKTRLV